MKFVLLWNLPPFRSPVEEKYIRSNIPRSSFSLRIDNSEILGRRCTLGFTLQAITGNLDFDQVNWLQIFGIRASTEENFPSKRFDNEITIDFET